MLRNYVKICRSMASSSINSDCWTSLACRKTDLRIDVTLDCGQSFRWHEINPGIWTGVMDGCVWFLKQTDDELCYKVHCSELDGSVVSRGHKKSGDEKDEETNETSSIDLSSTSRFANSLTNYFQLEISLQDLCAQFSERDTHFERKANQMKGVRLLRQDPVETLFSFICSSNNNISRICGMVERMSKQFGRKIDHIDGIDYYAFPTVDRLAKDDVEKVLKDLGFGYRAKFIAETAKQVLSKGGSAYLHDLRKADYADAKSKLMELPGVGPKVADCVCLMSLDKMEAVPVDVHVKQIAERDYSLRPTAKSCTDAVYKQIGDFFRDLWGPYAGWAQCVLFAADLKKFKDVDHPKTDKTPTESVDGNVKETRKRKRGRNKTTN